MWRKWVEKISGMRDSYLYISFIIKCDCKESVEIGVYLPKIEEKKRQGQLFTDGLK